MHHFVSTGNNKVAAEKCCVVFEPSSGRIRHVHRVITMAGADERSEQAITERALTLAKKYGAANAKLDVIHVDPKVLADRGRFQVDVKNRKLVALKSRSKSKTGKATIRENTTNRTKTESPAKRRRNK
jgi:hypothetical protein